MAMRIMKAAAAMLLLVAVSGAANAQRRYSDEEIVAAISNCLIENAPGDWQALVFMMDEAPVVAGKQKGPAVEHKVVVGAESNPQQNLKPCRPDYVQNAARTFRENQDEKAGSWTGITVTVYRDGRFSVTYRYPK